MLKASAIGGRSDPDRPLSQMVAFENSWFFVVGERNDGFTGGRRGTSLFAEAERIVLFRL